MESALLTLNVGSSSIKYALYKAENFENVQQANCIVKGIIELSSDHLDTTSDQTTSIEPFSIKDKIKQLLQAYPSYKVIAMIHRVVHGGQIYFDPIIINEHALHELKNFIPLAPMHMTPELSAIETLLNCYPDIPQIACFDTAFHGRRNPLDKLFAIPLDMFKSGIMRYGFHGLSYDYINHASQTLLSENEREKVIVAHLGNGASMTALENGQCVATSMGFSALDGLMMGSRCGSIDPGVLLYLLQEKHYALSDLTQLLHKQSGLLGVSGVSHDIRELEVSDHPDAHLAMDLFAYRCVKELGGLMAILGGVNSIIFTGGIGENSALIRGKILQRLSFLQLDIDCKHNHHNELKITTKDSAITVYVIPTNEEVMMAKHGMSLLQQT